jgi:hypothetical protein
VEHVAEGQETNRGTFQECSRGVDGFIKNFMIFEVGERGGSQKTITPPSLRYEDQVEVRLPLTTLWVVLRNELLIAGRPHQLVPLRSETPHHLFERSLTPLPSRRHIVALGKEE